MIEVIDGQLYQWDVGKTIEVTCSEATHLSLANQGDCKAVKQMIVDGKVEIPAYLLVSGKAIMAYAVKVTVDDVDGKVVEKRTTLESRCFAVKKRERPEDYVYESDKRNYIYELVSEAEKATEEAKKVTEQIKDILNAGGIPSGRVIKTVNGTGPDENGNVQVTSTCDLEQPRWGVEMLISVPGNGRNGYTLPMVKEEYDRLMRKCSAGEIRYRDGETEPIDISEIYHGMYDDTDPGGPKEPCLMYINGGGDNSDLILYGECAKIPSMYLDVPDIEQPELPSQDAEIIEGKLAIETLETGDGSILENHRFYKATAITIEGEYLYEDEPIKGETGKIYIDLESNKMYRYTWASDDYDDGYLNFIEIPNASGNLGDISAALDHILALQETLIGGGSQ